MRGGQVVGPDCSKDSGGVDNIYVEILEVVGIGILNTWWYLISDVWWCYWLFYLIIGLEVAVIILNNLVCATATISGVNIDNIAVIGDTAIDKGIGKVENFFRIVSKISSLHEGNLIAYHLICIFPYR